MKITIVVPAYNEEKRIRKVLNSLVKTDYKIIVVDDGSTDKTFTQCKLSKAKCQILVHKVNLGKGAAMKTGAEAAFKNEADAVIFMDSDGQHSSKDLQQFVKILETSNCQIVLGSRNLNHKVPMVRYLGNRVASLTIALLYGVYVSDLLCGYRALTKDAYKKIRWDSTGYAVETEMVIRAAKAGIKICEVPVETLYLDNVKGVTVLDAINILFEVIIWRLKI